MPKRSKLRKVKGGDFLAQGADTCVFLPPLTCEGDDPTKVPLDMVSRIVERDYGEQSKQDRVRNLIPQSYQKFFNFYVKACDSFSIYALDTRGTEESPFGCTLFANMLGNTNTNRKATMRDGLTNLITPILGYSLFDYIFKIGNDTRLAKSLRDIFVVLLNLQGLFVYGDTHLGNLAFDKDYTHLVLFDFGRVLISKDDYMDFVKRLIRERDSFGTYPQYFYCVLFLKFVETIGRLNTSMKMALRYVFDVLSLLGSLQLYRVKNTDGSVEVKRYENPVLPNLEECAMSIIEYIVYDMKVYSKEDVYNICNETIFKGNAIERRSSVVRTRSS